MAHITDLTKLTVNLTGDAMDALNSSAERLGDTRTETMNRAIQLYAHVTDLVPGGRLTFNMRDGERMTVVRTTALRRTELLAFGLVLIVLAFAAGVYSPW